MRTSQRTCISLLLRRSARDVHASKLASYSGRKRHAVHGASRALQCTEPIQRIDPECRDWLRRTNRPGRRLGR